MQISHADIYSLAEKRPLFGAAKAPGAPETGLWWTLHPHEQASACAYSARKAAVPLTARSGPAG